METVRNVAFAILLAVVMFAADKQVFASNSWQQWAQAHGCSMTDWSPTLGGLTGWCDCNDPEWGCSSDPEFCESFEGPCADYCSDYSCGFSEVTDCDPAVVGYVECSCDLCT
jgi:hypothetical protein